MAYLFLKDAHSILRWFVLLAAFWALFCVWRGFLTKAAWTKKDRIAGAIFTGILDLQFLVGLILWFSSPIVQAAKLNMGAAMKDSTMRFFLVEHPLTMLIAIIVAHVGFALAKRAPLDRTKFARTTTFFTIATILVLASIPWPFLKYGRPLLPSFLG